MFVSAASPAVSQLGHKARLGGLGGRGGEQSALTTAVLPHHATTTDTAIWINRGFIALVYIIQREPGYQKWSGENAFEELSMG